MHATKYNLVLALYLQTSPAVTEKITLPAINVYASKSSSTSDMVLPKLFDEAVLCEVSQLHTSSE